MTADKSTLPKAAPASGLAKRIASLLEGQAKSAFMAPEVQAELMEEAARLRAGDLRDIDPAAVAREIARKLSVAQQKAIVSYYGRAFGDRVEKLPATSTRGVLFELELITSPLTHDVRLTDLGGEVLRALGGGTLLEQVRRTEAERDAERGRLGLPPLLSTGPMPQAGDR